MQPSKSWTNNLVSIRKRAPVRRPDQLLIRFNPAPVAVLRSRRTLDLDWMLGRAQSLGDSMDTAQEAIELYEEILEHAPRHEVAHVNVGTLYYNRHDYDKAEQHYRLALEIEPRFALAYFDLANVLDETGRLREAISTYQTALKIAPTYADAHYNLALVFEKLREPRKALRHWQAYARLDRSGCWAEYARHQVRQILDREALRLIRR